MMEIQVLLVLRETLVKRVIPELLALKAIRVLLEQRVIPEKGTPA
jgi:hypothetical protein